MQVTEKAQMDKKSSPIQENIQKKRKKITQPYLENSGAYYLQRFSASTSQFRKVMTRKIDLSCKDHPEQNYEDARDLLEDVIIKFNDLGYLNDNNYARILLSSLKNRGFSLGRILQTLKQKGVPSEVIKDIQPEPSIDEERLAALIWMRKKRLGAFNTRPREGDMNRHLASLARSGFDYHTSRWVISLSINEAEILIEELNTSLRKCENNGCSNILL